MGIYTWVIREKMSNYNKRDLHQKVPPLNRRPPLYKLQWLEPKKMFDQRQLLLIFSPHEYFNSAEIILFLKKSVMRLCIICLCFSVTLKIIIIKNNEKFERCIFRIPSVLLRTQTVSQRHFPVYS